MLVFEKGLGSSYLLFYWCHTHKKTHFFLSGNNIFHGTKKSTKYFQRVRKTIYFFRKVINLPAIWIKRTLHDTLNNQIESLVTFKWPLSVWTAYWRKNKIIDFTTTKSHMRNYNYLPYRTSLIEMPAYALHVMYDYFYNTSS